MVTLYCPDYPHGAPFFDLTITGVVLCEQMKMAMATQVADEI
ncbi:hypothetical protein [Turneriella parva]|nr:hypothetical protein [Turneriella parva]